LTVVVVALCATQAVAAQRHHRASKGDAPSTKPASNIPQEKNRDAADVALDRKIKGICHSC
jgi:hypothetical protein